MDAARALRRYLVDHLSTFFDVLAKWDDGDECVSAKEFRQAWRVLELDAGLSVPRAALDALFAEMDVDGTQNIPWSDLSSALERMGTEEDAAPNASEISGTRTRREVVLPELPLSPRSVVDARHGAATHQPPRHANLSKRSHASPRHARAPSLASSGRAPLDARSAVSDATHKSRASAFTGCSTATGMSQSERKEYRARREQELAHQFERHNLPGFNVPEGGRYEPPGGYTSFAVLREARRPRGEVGGRTWRPVAGSWSIDALTQHTMPITTDGRPLDTTKVVYQGDPGRYVPTVHEMARPTRMANPGSALNSASPQRPLALNGRGVAVMPPWMRD